MFAGDTELNDYMDSLARDPNKFITPHNADTGETILHLLAKEGKMEILQNLLEDSRVERDLVRALLKQESFYYLNFNKNYQFLIISYFYIKGKYLDTSEVFSYVLFRF